ncbi:BON domain-containing protein [Chitinophagaceae bacterium MMS25-I14]
MKLKNVLLALTLVAATGTLLPSCKSKPKDADLKAAVEEKMKAMPEAAGMMVDVKDGVVTLSGSCKDDATKTMAENTAKSVKGVQSVTDNCTVEPPAPAPAPVVISADDALKSTVAAAIQAYNGVQADVKEGVVTLTGNIKKTDLPKLMQTVNALKPKKVENKLTVK